MRTGTFACTDFYDLLGYTPSSKSHSHARGCFLCRIRLRACHAIHKNHHTRRNAITPHRVRLAVRILQDRSIQSRSFQVGPVQVCSQASWREPRALRDRPRCSLLQARERTPKQRARVRAHHLYGFLSRKPAHVGQPHQRFDAYRGAYPVDQPP